MAILMCGKLVSFILWASITVLLFVTEDEDIEHQLVIRKSRHLSLCAQWREQVSLIPGTYPMLKGWGPNINDMETALKDLSQGNVDEEGSDDEQLNCTYNVEEADNNNVIEETESMAVSDAFRVSDNGLAFGRWESEDLWEDLEDDEEDILDVETSQKRSRQKYYM